MITASVENKHCLQWCVQLLCFTCLMQHSKSCL